jgi:hypothetical protein
MACNPRTLRFEENVIPGAIPGRRGKVIFGIAAAGVAIVLASAITNAAAETPRHQTGRVIRPVSMGTVTGTYWLYGGPVRLGDPDPQATIAGTITATGSTGKFTARAGANGRFTLHLVAGRYLLTGWTPHVNLVSQNGSVSNGSDCGSTEITVHAGRHVNTLVACIVP